jgi:hypothetical protein
VIRVAAFRLAEGVRDDGRDVIGDRRGQPLAPRLRLPAFPLAIRLAGLRFLLLFPLFFFAGALMMSSGVRGTRTAS